MDRPIPNVAKKLDPKEQARLMAQMGSIKKQSAQVISGEKGKTQTLPDPLEAKASVATAAAPPVAAESKSPSASSAADEVGKQGKGIDLKKLPTIYFKDCTDSTYTINHRCNKIFVEGCSNCTFHVNGPILTSVVEVWKGDAANTLHFRTSVKTLQIDLVKDIHIHFAKKEYFGHSLVHNHAENIHLHFADEPSLNCITGFNHMKEKHPDSSLVVDQFITRFVPNKVDATLPNVLTHERCVRLKNGFLSTEREADEWDRRNETAKEKHVQDFLKNAGITVNKKQEKKPARNSPCSCGSGKKYKKCCALKKGRTGVAQDDEEKKQ